VRNPSGERHYFSSVVQPVLAAVWSSVGRPVLPAAILPMIDSRRHLPHIVPDGVSVFVTWRLAGTIPKWRAEGLAYLEQDEQWDRPPNGPIWLADKRIARIVVEALLYSEANLHFYDLHAYVVMPHHVHVVCTPLAHMSRVLEWLKGATARRANRILNRSGAFWQDESYDHWIGTGREMNHVIGYIEYNPVNAGLVETPEDWPWSSASRPPIGSRQDRPPHTE